MDNCEKKNTHERSNLRGKPYEGHPARGPPYSSPHNRMVLPLSGTERAKNMQDTIHNPKHSRPLDVHRWSDHPEVVALVDKIWDGNALDALISTKGPKPKLAFRKQLRVLILDLYVAWLQDPDLSVGVSMDNNAWKTGSRYNALHISKKIKDIIHALVEAGLVVLNPGSYSGPGAKTNRTARIRASRKLQKQFDEAKFTFEDISYAEGKEIIVLKDDTGRLIEYEDTPQTLQMRADLRAYNDLIATTFIDLSGLPIPAVPTKRNGKD